MTRDLYSELLNTLRLVRQNTKGKICVKVLGKDGGWTRGVDRVDPKGPTFVEPRVVVTEEKPRDSRRDLSKRKKKDT